MRRQIAFVCLLGGSKFPVNFNWEWDFQQTSNVASIHCVRYQMQVLMLCLDLFHFKKFIASCDSDFLAKVILI